MKVETNTLLSVFEWGEIMGINPWELAQFGTGFPTEYEDGRQCASVWFRFPWQQDFLSREEIANAISSAEDALAGILGFYPAPRFIEQTVESPQPRDSRHYSSPYTGRGQRYTLELDWKYVRGGGSLGRTLIDDNVTVTFSDRDTDGVNDQFELSVPVSDITDPSEVALYFREADRMGDEIDETWRIRPIKVSISGGTATIKGHAALLVKPNLETGFTADILDVTSISNFVDGVAVYRRYLDRTADDATPNQGYALWDGEPCDDCGLGESMQTSRAVQIMERFSAQGQVSMTYAGDDCASWRSPDRLFLKYLAGYPPDTQGNMDRFMKDMVAKLATAWLPSDKCGCQRSNKIIAWWRGMGNSDETERKGRLVTFNEIDSPFGERRGAVYAWKRTWNYKALGHGVA